MKHFFGRRLGNSPVFYNFRLSLLADNIGTINKNTDTLIDASMEVVLEVNLEKTQYMLVSHDQNAGQNRDINIGNRSFENVSQFKYLGTTVTNQNLIQEEILAKLPNIRSRTFCLVFCRKMSRLKYTSL
jgi:hypothetical protein